MRVSLPDQSDLQARVFLDHEPLPQQLHGGVRPSTPRRVDRPYDAPAARADRRRRRDGAVVEADFDAASRSRPAPTSAGSMAPASRTGLEPDQRPDGDHAARVGRHADSSGAFVQGAVLADVEAVGHAERPRRTTGGTTTAQLSRRAPRPAPPTANNRGATSRTRTTRSSVPRGAALYHVTDKVTAWGSFGTGFRAPTLNELYRQFRVGALLTLANEQPRPRAAARRRARREHRAGGRTSASAPRGSTTG